MQREQLREEVIMRAESFKVLPSLPSVINEILTVINDDNSSFSQLQDVVKHDQSISAKIISIANSAYYTRGAPISTLKRAMVAVGFEELKDMITCMLLLQNMSNRHEMCKQDMAILWRHSVEVGYAAKALNARTLTDKPEKVFTAAILHDLGKVVLCTYGEQYRKMATEAQRTGTDICTVERNAFGIDHQELGYEIAIRARFPSDLLSVIQSHHGGLDGSGSILDIVKAADMFIRNSSADSGPFAAILYQERDYIEKESERISRLLGVT